MQCRKLFENFDNCCFAIVKLKSLSTDLFSWVGDDRFFFLCKQFLAIDWKMVQYTKIMIVPVCLSVKPGNDLTMKSEFLNSFTPFSCIGDIKPKKISFNSSYLLLNLFFLSKGETDHSNTRPFQNIAQ